MYTPATVSEMLHIPDSTLRHYAALYKQFFSPTAQPASKRRRYTEEDILTLRKIRKLASQKKSRDEIIKLLPVIEDDQADETSLALIPSIAHKFEYLDSVIAQLQAESKAQTDRLEKLEAWIKTPWYKKLGKQPPEINK